MKPTQEEVGHHFSADVAGAVVTHVEQRDIRRIGHPVACERSGIAPVQRLWDGSRAELSSCDEYSPMYAASSTTRVGGLRSLRRRRAVILG